MEEIDITTIRYVCTVASFHSFSKAADELFITQPSLSQAIQKLENKLGYPLFKRSTRKVILTDEGAEFIKSAKPLLEHFDKFQNEVNSIQKREIASLTVGLLPIFMELNIQQYIQYYNQTHDHIHITIETHTSQKLLRMLDAGKSDVAICYVTNDWISQHQNKYDCMILDSKNIDVLMHENNPLSSQKYLSLTDIKDETIYTLEKKSAVEKEVFHEMEKIGIAHIHSKTSPSFRNMIGTIAMNQGICFHSEGIWNEYIHPPLVSIPIIPRIQMFITIISLRNTSADNTVRVFREYLYQDYTQSISVYPPPVK